MRIAVFGGSFDPVHKEHVALIRAAIQSLALDKAFIVPAFAPPHKNGKRLSADADRLEMCRLAFSEIPNVVVSDWEIAQGGTSYTYRTCRHFREEYPTAEIFWLVGTDMLRDFPTWKNPQEILRCVTLGVCSRAEKSEWVEEELKNFRARFGVDFQVIDYKATDVSSTQIRVLAGAGMRLTPLVEDSVAAYIERKELYKIPFASCALALEKQSRKEHSLRVASVAAKRAVELGIDEKRAIAAALFHDCAKNLKKEDALLEGFVLAPEWGNVPDAVFHQFAGAYLAEKKFGVTDSEVLDAIRYHTSGRARMGELEKLIFLADMVESGRDFKGVETIRELFFEHSQKGVGELDACLKEALSQTVEFLKEKGAEIYPLTIEAYKFYAKQEAIYGGNDK